MSVPFSELSWSLPEPKNAKADPSKAQLVFILTLSEIKKTLHTSLAHGHINYND